MRRAHTLSLLLLIAAVTTLRPAIAQNVNDDSRTNEVWGSSQRLRPQPSTDITPVEFTFLGVKYRVPKNYIVHMDGPLAPPTFRVTFPDFKPLTEETRQCLTQPRAYWPQGCVPIEFWLEGNEPTSADDDHFNNMRGWFQGRSPRQGPNGLEVYENGVGDDNELQVYRKTISTHTLLITCRYYAADGKRDAVCTNYRSPLPNGNSLSYRIGLDQIENAEKIDSGIRSLIDSFTLKGETP